MNNKEPTSREKFEAFDKEHFGKKDIPINYETWECPILGTRYVDVFTQTRYSYWQACEAEQAKEIEALKHDLYSYMEASNGYTNEIMEHSKVIAELKQTLKEHEFECITKGVLITELVEALEDIQELPRYFDNSQQSTLVIDAYDVGQIVAEALAKVKDK